MVPVSLLDLLGNFSKIISDFANLLLYKANSMTIFMKNPESIISASSLRIRVGTKTQE